MSQHHHTMDSTSVFGTAGGTLLTIFNIGTGDVIKTVVLAMLGAAVSFFATEVLKWTWKRLKGWYRDVLSK